MSILNLGKHVSNTSSIDCDMQCPTNTNHVYELKTGGTLSNTLLKAPLGNWLFKKFGVLIYQITSLAS